MTATGSRRTLARLACATLAALATLALTPVAAAQGRFEWRDVRQHVTLEPDGGVVIVDERTLWTNQDFGEAFVCIQLERGQRLTMLPETGAISPGPPAEGRTQACDGGTEVFVRQASRVSERRVRFAYRLDGTVAAHRDVVEWYWNVLERDRPVVLGYQLEVVAPGPMEHPFDAYVMRYANPEEPRVSLSGDRRVLRVAFDRVPAGDGVEIRWFMDPVLFTMPSSGQDAFERLLRDQMRVAGVQERERLAQAVRSHPAFGLLPAVTVLWLFAGIVGAYRRVGREPVVDAMRYPFEPPSELPPAIVTTLLHQQPNPSSMGPAWFATIMDLARRGFLRFEGEGRAMAIHLAQDADTGPLEGFERSVLTYLGGAAQSGRSGRRDAESVTLSELTTYGRSNAQRFLSSFGAAIIAWGKGYFGGPYTTDESRAARNRWAGRGFLVALGCGLLAWALLDVARVLAIVGAVLAVVLVLVAAAALPAWRPEIAKERAGWIGFRRTLTSYTRMRDAPPDFFRLWDRYYVYAAALGVAERYLRTLARAAPRAGVDQAAMTRQAAWLGAARSSDLGQVARSVSRMSSALAQAGASASSGGSSSGGGGGGGGGSSGGR